MTPDLFGLATLLQQDEAEDFFALRSPIQTLAPIIPRSKISFPNIDITAQLNEPTFIGESQLAFTVLENGVDISQYILVQRDPINISYTKNSGSRGTCTFTIFDRAGLYRPTPRATILVYENETKTRIFGGIIATTEEINYSGQAAHEIRVTCTDFGSLLDRAAVAAYFEPPGIIYSPATMVLELLRTYRPDLGIFLAFPTADGTMITTEVIISHVYMSQAIQQVLEKDGLDYFVDAYKGLHIVSSATGYGAAPYNITDDDGNVQVNTMRVRRDETKYANVVGVRAALRQPAMWHEIFTGDGVSRHFITKYIIDNKPIVLVNGVSKTVVLYANYGLEPHDFSYGENSYGVFSNPYAAPYTSSDTIEVFYPGKIQPIIYARDEADIIADGREIAALIEVKDVYDQDLLEEIAAGWLARLNVVPYFVDWQTLRHGLLPGQLININKTKPLVPDVDLVIQSVSGTCGGRKTLAEELGTGKKAYFKWNISATNAQDQGQRAPEKLVLDLRKERVQPQDRHQTRYAVYLYETLPGATNPGLAVGITPSAARVEKPGFLKQVSVRFEDFPPQANLCQFDCLHQPASTPGVYTSVFANGEYIEVDVDQTATVVKFNFTTWPFPVGVGDLFKFEIVTADDTAKDGKGEIIIQG